MRRYLDEAGEAGDAAGQLLSHILGYTGPVTRDDLDELLDPEGTCATTSSARPASRPASRTSYVARYGSQLVERDASGRLVKVIETVREPEPGTNLMLTIDAETQRLATRRSSGAWRRRTSARASRS